MRLAIVTATTNAIRAEHAMASWVNHSVTTVYLAVVPNGGTLPYLGTVPAFRKGVDEVLSADPEVDVIACLHDDLLIHEDGWDRTVIRAFERHPRVGLLGFGGAIGLGSDDLYQTPYDPMQLARIGFRSNLVDAEAHGMRSLLPERVACLDGFSQIGRRVFFEGATWDESRKDGDRVPVERRPWTYLEQVGMLHHFYDGALGCLARRYGWDVFYQPIRCHHLGGQTAVGDQGYHAWAARQIDGGDRGIWETSHRLGYDLFKDVLPLRVAQA